ncbi:hypothetical protein IWX75_000701 [Arthrobacter sp. CAN_A6]
MRPYAAHSIALTVLLSTAGLILASPAPAFDEDTAPGSGNAAQTMMPADESIIPGPEPLPIDSTDPPTLEPSTPPVIPPGEEPVLAVPVSPNEPVPPASLTTPPIQPAPSAFPTTPNAEPNEPAEFAPIDTEAAAGPIPNPRNTDTSDTSDTSGTIIRRAPVEAAPAPIVNPKRLSPPPAPASGMMPPLAPQGTLPSKLSVPNVSQARNLGSTGETSSAVTPQPPAEGTETLPPIYAATQPADRAYSLRYVVVGVLSIVALVLAGAIGVVAGPYRARH